MNILLGKCIVHFTELTKIHKCICSFKSYCQNKTYYSKLSLPVDTNLPFCCYLAHLRGTISKQSARLNALHLCPAKRQFILSFQFFLIIYYHLFIFITHPSYPALHQGSMCVKTVMHLTKQNKKKKVMCNKMYLRTTRTPINMPGKVE